MRKLVFATALIIGITVSAQNGHRKGMKDLNPEQIAVLQTKKMTLALDLTTVQQKQIQKLNLDNATYRLEKIKEMKSKKESGETRPLTSEERYALQTARLDRQIAQKEKLKSILTQEQLEKWEMIKAKRLSHRKGKHKGAYTLKAPKQ